MARAFEYTLTLSFVVLPKSVSPSRIAQNPDALDFEIDEQEMAAGDGVQNRLGSDSCSIAVIGKVN